MLLKCIGNNRGHLSSEKAKRAWDNDYHVSDTGLIIGEKYIAYGIIFINGEDLPKFLVCVDADDEYPVGILAEHFAIIDEEIPEGWVFKTSTSNYTGSVILPQKMADEDLFMEKLYDGDPDAIQYFLGLKKKMEERYKDNL